MTIAVDLGRKATKQSNKQKLLINHQQIIYINEPVHEITDNVVCVTSKASDQPVHMRSLIGAFASRLSIL